MFNDDNRTVSPAHPDGQERYGSTSTPAAQRPRCVPRERTVTALHEIYLKYGRITSHIQKLITDLVFTNC